MTLSAFLLVTALELFNRITRKRRLHQEINIKRQISRLSVMKVLSSYRQVGPHLECFFLDCNVQRNGKVQTRDCGERHFALCKNNQTQATGVSTTFNDDIMYTPEQARAIYAENEEMLGELPLGPGTCFDFAEL